MCELFGMSSRRPTEVTVSLEELARHGSATSPNREGWGIAFYDDDAIRLIKEPGSAGESPCLRFVEQEHLASRIVIAHIRRASRGSIALRNTHPFERELGGRTHVFAHNGDLPDLTDDGRFGIGRFRPVGETDSELAFCALLERLAHDVAGSELPSIDARLAVVAGFAREISTLGPANFLYSDGTTLFVHSDRRRGIPPEAPSSPGLHSLECAQVDASEPILEGGGVCVAGAEQQRVTLIASVPLSTDAWVPIERGAVVAFENGRPIATRRRGDTAR